jgi:small subunit ribosomal protein S13
MPRILGVDIPNEKPTYISLQYLHGVGQTVAIQVCQRLNLNKQRRAREMSDDDIQRVNSLLDNEYTVEGQLRRQTQENIGRLKNIQSYRGSRHRKNLPVRGQRTRTNSRTRKGVKKTVAGKKGVKEMRH